MSRPLLSVCMPSYNYGHYVGEALDAIMRQTYRPMEVIVVDDGSTDDSPQVVEQFASRHPEIRFYRNPQNLGVLKMIEILLEKARGDYLITPAADDKIYDGFFAQAMEMLLQHPRAGLCCGDIVSIGPEGELHGYRSLGLSPQPRHFSPSELVARCRTGNLFLTGAICIFRREALLAPGVVRLDLRWFLDWFYSFVLAFRHGLCYVPSPAAMIRRHAGNYSQHAQGKGQSEALLRMLDLLKQAEFADVLPAFRASGVLGGARALPVIARHPQHWDLLSAPLLRYWLQDQLRNLVNRLAPDWVKSLRRQRLARSLAFPQVPS